MASSAPESDFLSLKEAAVLAGLSERVIRNEVDRGVIRPIRSARTKRAARLPADAICYLMLVRHASIPLARRDRVGLYRLMVERRPNAGGGWTLRGRGVRKGNVSIDVSAFRKAADARLRLYRTGRRRIVSDAAILGGEPVFAGTRLAVRHIGALALRGIPAREIRADHPALSDSDIELARLLAAVGPKPGRPRKPLTFRRVA